MQTVLLVAYLLIVLALIAVILLQRSEGGALGIGGGGNGLMTARGSANLLTRTTAILGTLFFAVAIGLTLLSEFDRGTSGILDRATEAEDGAAPTTVLDALNSLQGDSALPVPEADAAAVPSAETPANADPVTDGTLLPASGATPEASAATPAASAATPAPAGDLPVPEIPAETPDAPVPAAPATN
jgi:preprotein translocase subunit SecG